MGATGEIILSEITQAEKYKCVFSPICAFQLYIIILQVHFRVPVEDRVGERLPGRGALK